MKKYLIVLMLFISSIAFSAEQSAPLETFQGGVDILSNDKLNPANAPFSEILNVRTDDYAQITKRYGSVKFNTTAMGGSLATRNLFTFNQNNGNSYIIASSSDSVFASQNGTFISIISGRSTSQRDRFTVAQNKLFGSNGTNPGWSWDGVTTTEYSVSNSTGFPIGRYIIYWHQRLWIAGNANYPSRLYYSVSGHPEVFNDFIDIATDDGDQITGIMIGSNGTLIVTKNHATYLIYEYETGGFTYQQLSPTIGCIYDTTMCMFNGMPTFVSERGVEQLNGSVFNDPPLSANIDNYFKSLSFQQVQTGIVQDDTVVDWNAGTIICLDTTTYVGSIGMSVKETIISTVNISLSSMTTETNGQRYTTDGSTLTKFTFSNPDREYNSVILDSTYTIKSINLIYDCLIGYDNPYFAVYGCNTSQTNTPWHGILISSFSLSVVGFTSTSFIVNGDYQVIGVVRYGNSSLVYLYETEVNIDSYSYVYDSYGNFTSQIHNAANWSTWGNFATNEVVPTGSNINYYAITATSTYNIPLSTPFAIYNGSPINSSTGPYIQIISSFSRTDMNAIPMIYNYNVPFYGTMLDIPFATVYNRKLYIQTKAPASANNDTVLVYQKDGTWTKDTVNGSGFCIFRDNLYFGSSVDNGLVYRYEVPGIYADDGVGYAAYWTSKPISVHPFSRVLFKNLWIQSDITSNNIDLGYRFDETSGAYANNTFSSNTTYPWRKLTLPPKMTRAIQVRIGDFTGVPGSYFKINRCYITYDDKLRIE